MGYTRSWDQGARATYAANVQHRAMTGTPTFEHTADIHAGRAVARVHERLDPAGLRVRESRDSANNPESLAVMVMLDVTGSMRELPGVIQARLGQLMATIVDRGYHPHPQMLFGAIGDATGDHAPLQLGQFETGIEMEKDLTAFYLEGNGQGGLTESYEMAHYVAARHTATDCFEKRGKKGYLFTVGDEHPYPRVSRRQVKALIGPSAGIEADELTAAIVAEAQQRWHVFHVLPMRGQKAHYPEVSAMWTQLLGGDHLLRLENAQNVSELIALVIGLCEGRVNASTLTADMTALGLDLTTIRSLVDTMLPLATSRGIVLRT
jgi:hypothetical protein